MTGREVGRGAADAPGYHGLPALKAPVWTWEVPVYFFVGGLAGMAAVLATAAGLADPGTLWDGASGPAGSGRPVGFVAAALLVAAAGATVSALLLIRDLGRPRRFLHMLRVCKPRSPMSVGVWALVAFSGSAVAALAGVLALPAGPGPAGTVGRALVVAALLMAGFLGALLATYTGVLLAATAIPAWHRHRGFLPLHFGVAGLGSAAALLELLGYPLEPLHLLGIAAAAAETLLWAGLERNRHGPEDRPLRRGRSGALVRGAALLSGPVSLALRLSGAVPGAAIAFLAGALLSRFGWVEAGRASARDPAAVLTNAETSTQPSP